MVNESGGLESAESAELGGESGEVIVVQFRFEGVSEVIAEEIVFVHGAVRISLSDSDEDFAEELRSFSVCDRRRGRLRWRRRCARGFCRREIQRGNLANDFVGPRMIR